MALVIGGLTLSTALGMPLGNVIGGVDWRLTLSAVAALGVVAAIGIVAQGRAAGDKPDRPAWLRGAQYTHLGTVTADAGTFPQAATVILDAARTRRRASANSAWHVK